MDPPEWQRTVSVVSSLIENPLLSQKQLLAQNFRENMKTKILVSTLFVKLIYKNS
jgi:hypothetical protein